MQLQKQFIAHVNHFLNLSIFKSYNVMAIKNAVGFIKETLNFLIRQPKEIMF